MIVATSATVRNLTSLSDVASAAIDSPLPARCVRLAIFSAPVTPVSSVSPVRKRATPPWGVNSTMSPRPFQERRQPLAQGRALGGPRSDRAAGPGGLRAGPAAGSGGLRRGSGGLRRGSGGLGRGSGGLGRGAGGLGRAEAGS